MAQYTLNPDNKINPHRFYTATLSAEFKEGITILMGNAVILSILCTVYSDLINSLTILGSVLVGIASFTVATTAYYIAGLLLGTPGIATVMSIYPDGRVKIRVIESILLFREEDNLYIKSVSEPMTLEEYKLNYAWKPGYPKLDKE